VLGRPAVLTTPAFALKLAFGEMAGLLLTGQNVVPARALEDCYVFKHPRLEQALEAILR
jgi:NAD dependent epimerase/dehydratase family enzyme